jgi:hypothetical protein
VVFRDDVGALWFGIVVATSVRRLSRRAVVKVRVGSETVEIADRDVMPWADSEHFVETWPDAWPRRYDRDDKLAFRRGLASNINPGERPRVGIDLGEIVMVVEVMNPNTRDRVFPGELGVIIGRLSATDFILHLSRGVTVQANGHQIVPYQPGLPELIVPHMNQGGTRDVEAGPDKHRDHES